MPDSKCCCPPEKEKNQGYCHPPQPEATEDCCDKLATVPERTEKSSEIPGYTVNAYVYGWLDTPVGKVPQVSAQLSFPDLRGRWAMRWGIGREVYRVTPGLYAVGTPHAESPLLVSANYKLSFDCLRTSLKNVDAWILVIDTKGVNVWCAAGKGTFGTDEIVKRCRLAQIEKVIEHKVLILPQLGAPGIAAHQVKKETGFTVIYGPVRAADLPDFLAAGMQATPIMRRVTFTTMERLVLTPVEITVMRKTIFYSVIILFFLSGIGANLFSFAAAWDRYPAALVPGLTGLISGCVIAPVLLPWLPGRMFAVKGAVVGTFAATILAATLYRQASVLENIALFLFVGTIASYTAMNFTGSSTFTSPSGVQKEMRTAIPVQALSLLVTGFIWILSGF